MNGDREVGVDGGGDERKWGKQEERKEGGGCGRECPGSHSPLRS